MKKDNLKYGRVTIPTDLDIVKETLEVKEKWGADALRDADGTTFPKELANVDAKIYATYYTTRKDNEWAKNNLDEVQQMYIMTEFTTAYDKTLKISLMKNLYKDMLKVNENDDIKRWWEVIDRTTNEVVDVKDWDYIKEEQSVLIKNAIPFHEYTLSFLAYIMWDPVHMYNAITNDWKDFEKQITFDVRQVKTKEYSMKRLRKFIEENPHVDVIRFTTFFHQFTLIFDELAREKYVDWYGYSASVSPYILEEFEKEVGYKFRAEYIIDQGYMNNNYRIPSKEFIDFRNFQAREVAKLAKEMVNITHEYKKEAMMFLGDHWIGIEPFMDEFKNIGLDAVVGSVGNAQTLRLITDIKDVKYREGRFLPYFFPDVFNEKGNPLKEAISNWVLARRALLRNPLDRIGYGGYLKLALKFPEFITYIEKVCNEFREIYENTKNSKAFSLKKIAILSSHGKERAWGHFMVHHAIYHKKNYSYAGIIEALASAPFDVSFISFQDVLDDDKLLEQFDVIFNIGDAYTAYSGAEYWINEKIVSRIKEYIYKGGGFVGVGEPSAYQFSGRYFQLASVLGVEYETGLSLNYDKYNKEVHKHFILDDDNLVLDFGEGKKDIYALNAKILYKENEDVQLAVNEFGKGKTVYLSGLPYNLSNSRLLHRIIFFASSSEYNLKQYFSSNYNVDVNVYKEAKKYCVLNNTDKIQETTIYLDANTSFNIVLEAYEIKWYNLE